MLALFKLMIFYILFWFLAPLALIWIGSLGIAGLIIKDSDESEGKNKIIVLFAIIIAILLTVGYCTEGYKHSLCIGQNFLFNISSDNVECVVTENGNQLRVKN
jgi:hypothetical protein